MIPEGHTRTIADLQQELRLVRRLWEAIAQAIDIAQVCRAFALEMERYVNADWAAVALIREAEVWVRPLDSPSEERKAALPLPETPLVSLAASRKTVVEVGLAASDSGWLGCPGEARAVVWLPLIARGEVFGALAVVSFSNRVFSDRQLAWLEHFASFLGCAVRSFQFQEEVEALKREDAERMSFMDALVHELKTPLTSIIASVGLLREEFEGQGGGAQARLVRNLEKSAQNLDSRLSELLDLARARIGAFRLSPEPSTIGPLLKGAVAQVMPLAQSKGQRLDLRLPRSLPPVNVDRRRLEQVMLNLLSNAVKFTDEGGSIEVRVSARDGNLTVEVQDSGTPIPEEEQKRLFQPYYRIEADRQRLPGLGLGLAVSKWLIEAHGGKIWVGGRAGEGNTFAFSLPCAGAARRETLEET